MPELPEVQTVVDTLRPLVAGALIHTVHHIRPDIVRPASADLSGLLVRRRIVSVDRRAKRIVFSLDTGSRFYIHLGMSGRLQAEPASAPLQPHTHFIADMKLNRQIWQLRFRDPRRFGGIFWMGDAPDPDDIGPEPLTLSVNQLMAILQRTSRNIKTALLDQRLIAGLGNIYADEALFTAGIHPLTPANALSRDQATKLNRAIQQTLRKAIRHKGSTLRDYVDSQGNRGAFQNLHRVYARAGQPCMICATPLNKITLTGRSTHFCPTCQPQ